VRYYEFSTIAETPSLENLPTPMDRSKRRRRRAADRLEQMNRDRIEMLARAVDRELRRGLVSGEYERHYLTNILAR
jgi:hypothetical protein